MKVDKAIMVMIIGIALIWGYANKNKALKYQSLYLEKDYILYQIQENHPEITPIVKEAKDAYLDIGTTLDVPQYEGLDN